MTKKGFWVVIVLILAVNVSALEFEWSLTQYRNDVISLGIGYYALFTLPYQAPLRASADITHFGRSRDGKDVEVGIKIYNAGQAVAAAYGQGKSRGGAIGTTPSSIQALGDEIRVMANSETGEPGYSHVWIEAPDYRANVTRSDGSKFLGSAADFAVPTYFTSAAIQVRSKTPGVRVWVDSSKNIFACIDSDSNNLCDSSQSQSCDQAGGDWGGVWFDGTRRTTQSICCGVDAAYKTEPCKFYSTIRAICGKNPANKWKWSSAALAGQAIELSCPGNASFLADGQTLSICGSVPSALSGTTFNSFTKKLVSGHEFLCKSSITTIYECVGDGTSLSEGNQVKASGDWVTDDFDVIQFCAPDGTWVSDLNTNKDACVSAGKKWPGIAWSGTKCCGDPADDNTQAETYEDSNGAGGCFNNQFIPTGSFLLGNATIMNYKGKFYVCNPSLQPNAVQSASLSLFQNTGVTPTAKGPCGDPLKGALLTGVNQNAVCMPGGNWLLISSNATQVVKSISWSPLQNEQSKGCCTDNECWDGGQCRTIGEYKNLGDRGFRCQ